MYKLLGALVALIVAFALVYGVMLGWLLFWLMHPVYGLLGVGCLGLLTYFIYKCFNGGVQW